MPSVNDNFADAIEVAIATAGGTYTSSALANTGNTTETDEPSHVSNSLSMWFGYTPTSSGTATLDTILSTAITGTDTVLVVYTGTAVDSLTYVTHDDDGGGSGKSQISSLAVTAGTTYWIQACGYGSTQVNMVLRVTGPETSGGGAAYDKTPADAEGITDARTVVQDAERSQADPVGLTDARTVAQALARTQADALGITDTVDVVLTGDSEQTPADAVGLTDAVTAALDSVRTVADLLGIVDTDNPIVLEFGETADDPVGLTDTTAVVQARVVTIADSVGATDTATPTGEGDETATPADDIGASDTTTVVGDWTRGPSDTAGLTDTAGAVATLVRTHADPVGLSDAVTVALEQFVELADTLGILDLASNFVGLVETPAARTVVVPAENRTTVVPAENRTTIVPA